MEPTIPERLDWIIEELAALDEDVKILALDRETPLGMADSLMQTSLELERRSH